MLVFFVGMKISSNMSNLLKKKHKNHCFISNSKKAQKAEADSCYF